MLAVNGLIPIHDENPTHHTPVVTIALIVINVLAFFLFEPQFGSTLGLPPIRYQHARWATARSTSFFSSGASSRLRSIAW